MCIQILHILSTQNGGLQKRIEQFALRQIWANYDNMIYDRWI